MFRFVDIRQEQKSENYKIFLNNNFHGLTAVLFGHEINYGYCCSIPKHQRFSIRAQQIHFLTFKNKKSSPTLFPPIAV